MPKGKPKDGSKNPGGRPSRIDKINKEGVRLCYSKGFTDAETALALQITEQTLNNWKKKDPKFFETIKDWKAQADGEIEVSLRDRAKGYSCPETKAQWVQDENGGRWEYAEMIRHYPPDPTSMIFWLKNRQPEKWRDKQEFDVNASVSATVKLDEADKADIAKLLIGLKETLISESRKGV